MSEKIINQVILLCKITKPFELRYSGEGKAYGSGTVHFWHGERSKKTSFFDIVAFGLNAENLAKLDKGSKIGLVGSLSQDVWESQDGGKRSKVKILVNQWKLIALPPNQQQTIPKEETDPDPFEGMDE